MSCNDLRRSIRARAARALRVLLAASALLWVFAGCGSDKATSPVRPVPVTLVTVGGSSSARYVATAAPLATASIAAADSDSVTVTFTKALLVVRDVRFVRPDDSDGGETDTTGVTDSLNVDDGDGGHVIFRGPFVLDALSGTADPLDTLMVLPGDFLRVQGHLRSLRDTDDDAADFPDLVGYTVWIEGVVEGDGGGPFSFRARIDDEFMIRGSFRVDVDTPATAFLVFDPAGWLTAHDGRFLDPRDPNNELAIKSAIRHAIKTRIDAP